jgi:hypothetical protein
MPKTARYPMICKETISYPPLQGVDDIPAIFRIQIEHSFTPEPPDILQILSIPAGTFDTETLMPIWGLPFHG